MQKAMAKQWFTEDENGNTHAGPALADPRAWWGQSAILAWTDVPMVVGTKGAGLALRPAGRLAAGCCR